MAGAGGGGDFAAAGFLGFVQAVGAGEVAGLEEGEEGRVLEGFGGDLSGFAGAQKELFAAGEGDAEGFAGFVGDVHGGLGWGGE